MDKSKLQEKLEWLERRLACEEANFQEKVLWLTYGQEDGFLETFPGTPHPDDDPLENLEDKFQAWPHIKAWCDVYGKEYPLWVKTIDDFMEFDRVILKGKNTEKGKHKNRKSKLCVQLKEVYFQAAFKLAHLEETPAHIVDLEDNKKEIQAQEYLLKIGYCGKLKPNNDYAGCGIELIRANSKKGWRTVHPIYVLNLKRMLLMNENILAHLVPPVRKTKSKKG